MFDSITVVWLSKVQVFTFNYTFYFLSNIIKTFIIFHVMMLTNFKIITQ